MADSFLQFMPWIALSLFVIAAAHVLLILFLRVRRAVPEESSHAEPILSEPQPADAAVHAELQSLRALEAKLDEQNKERAQAEAQRKMLQARIRALEAKIQEYEILQEELGALTELKVENARLKEALVQLDKPTAEEPPAPPAPTEPLRVVKATEPVTPPEAIAANKG